jgi:ribosomal protein S10
MFFYIEISSKNEDSLKKFLTFISEIKTTNLFITNFPKQNIKKVVTVLKSPHVNKSAQEQFEYRIYTKNLSVSSFQQNKFLSLFKRIQNSSFPGIRFKVKGLFEQKKELKNLLLSIDPDNLDLNSFKNSASFSALKLKTTQYFQMFEGYGEHSIKKDFCLFALR